MPGLDELDKFPSAVPAENLMIAKNRFLSEDCKDGVCAADFLALCDEHGVKVSESMRMHIESTCLRISINSILCRETGARNNLRRVIVALYNILLGIVPEGQLRLKIDMIPKPLHGRNLRKALGQTRWSALCKQILDEREPVCEICGAHPNNTSELHAHEEWEYNLVKRPNRATLIRIGLICKLCHAVEHIGNSLVLVQKGELPESYLHQLPDHFCAVNGVSKDMWIFHFNESWKKWKARSRRSSWRIEFGSYESLLTEIEREAIQPSRSASKPHAL